MKNATKATVTNGVGKLTAIAAPIAAAATQFPLWIEKGGDTTAAGLGLSGAFIAVAIISFVPALKGIRQKLKNPGAFFLWAILFAIVWGLAPIIEEMKVITLAGITSNGGAFVLGKVSEIFKSAGLKTDNSVINEFLAAANNKT